MNEYKVLLLDLDGTLLDIEVSFFLGPMVDAMHRCFQDILDMDRFREGLFGGTEAIMIEARSNGESNRDGFHRVFGQITGLADGQFVERFDYFYRKVFPTLTGYGRPVKGAPKLVLKAAARGYTLCLATNPIFPVSAVVERMGWAGLDPDTFSFIPGLENMSTCKPRVDYYLELCSILGVSPSDCLMVGNDVQQDLPASRTGMGTFLVEGRVVDRGRTDLVPDARGSLGDLERILGLE